jgi:hypothetical protein
MLTTSECGWMAFDCFWCVRNLRLGEFVETARYLLL